MRMKRRQREEKGSAVTSTCCLHSVKERMAALISGVQMETRRGVVCEHWDKYQLLGYTPSPMLSSATAPNSAKHQVTAKFMGATSSISLTTNSPPYSSYSCTRHLIIVLYRGTAGCCSFFSLANRQIRTE